MNIQLPRNTGENDTDRGAKISQAIFFPIPPISDNNELAEFRDDSRIVPRKLSEKVISDSRKRDFFIKSVLS